MHWIGEAVTRGITRYLNETMEEANVSLPLFNVITKLSVGTGTVSCASLPGYQALISYKNAEL